jgi:hypothetical protein
VSLREIDDPLEAAAAVAAIRQTASIGTIGQTTIVTIGQRTQQTPHARLAAAIARLMPRRASIAAVGH